MKGPKPIPISERVKEVDGCLVFTGPPRRGGYGSVRRGGKDIRVTHLVWEEAHGAIPDGMLIRHTCDNPPCIKLEHLVLGTTADNVADRVARGRSARGETNGRARLTADQVREIYRRAASGTERQVDIAADFNIGRARISSIVTGRTWAHVTSSLGARR